MEEHKCSQSFSLFQILESFSSFLPPFDSFIPVSSLHYISDKLAFIWERNIFLLKAMSPNSLARIIFYCLLIVHVNGYQYKPLGPRSPLEFQFKNRGIRLNMSCILEYWMCCMHYSKFEGHCWENDQDFFFKKREPHSILWQQLKAACFSLEAKIGNKCSSSETEFLDTSLPVVATCYFMWVCHQISREECGGSCEKCNSC